MKKDFWSELELRLEENQQLETGGIPEVFRPIASILGLHLWQSLFLISFTAAVVLVLLTPEKGITIAEKVLLIW